MDTIFMNSENSKTSKRHVLKLKFTSKLNLRLGKKVIDSSNLSIKSSYNNNKFKISATTWNDKFELLSMDRIQYQTFNIILSIFKKTWRRY